VKLKTKLLALTLAPLAVALGLSAMDLVVQYGSYAEARVAALNLRYMEASSAYIEALQRERESASLLLSGGGDPARFDASIKATDDGRVPWVDAFGKVRLPAVIQREEDKALAAVRSVRDAVGKGKADRNAAANAYSSAVDVLLDGSRIAASRASPGTATRVLGLVMLEESKEWADRTRVTASGALAQDKAIGDSRALDFLVRFGSIRALLYSRALDISDESQADRDIAFKSNEYEEISASVLSIVRKSAAGGYGIDEASLDKNMSFVIDKIQAVIGREEGGIRDVVSTEVASIGRSLAATAAAVALILLATIGAALLIMASIVRRLSIITFAFHDVAAGEGDLSKRIEEFSDDEIGALAADFNSFSGVIRGLVVKVKDETAKISGNMDELAANMNETAGAVQEMAATIDSIKQQGISQAASVSESSATMEEIAKRVEILAAAIERQAENISLSGSSIEEMVANIKSVTANVENMGAYYQGLQSRSDEGMETIQLLSSQAKAIVVQSQSLQEANSIIRGIASQTNLLAMNAEIEAAHAGEAGKGFSVVSDEIRKLAENAASQSEAVADDLESIQRAIADIVSSSGEAEKSFKGIVEQISVLSALEGEVKNAMREQSSGSSNILQALAEMRIVTTEVREEASAMREGDGAVLEEMRRLQRLTAELENGMSEMASGAAQIRSAAVATNELSFRAVDSVRSLASETEKFRT
jgi:methyl-accepting chemotaxis protein